MEDTMELVGEVVLVDIGDLQGWHILEAGVFWVREGRRIELAKERRKLALRMLWRRLLVVLILWFYEILKYEI